VRQYEKNVFNTAYRLSGSYEDASDIAQEAFVRAWNNLRSFRGDAQFSTWLYRIVTNVFLDDRKKKRARPHRSLDDELALDESSVERQYADPSPGPVELAEGDERKKLLENAIATLRKRNARWWFCTTPNNSPTKRSRRSPATYGHGQVPSQPRPSRPTRPPRPRRGTFRRRNSSQRTGVTV
jgi:RNA polymerase sigma factor (sigma-70 family)